MSVEYRFSFGDNLHGFGGPGGDNSRNRDKWKLGGGQLLLLFGFVLLDSGADILDLANNFSDSRFLQTDHNLDSLDDFGDSGTDGGSDGVLGFVHLDFGLHHLGGSFALQLGQFSGRLVLDIFFESAHVLFSCNETGCRLAENVFHCAGQFGFGCREVGHSSVPVTLLHFLHFLLELRVPQSWSAADNGEDGNGSNNLISEQRHSVTRSTKGNDEIKMRTYENKTVGHGDVNLELEWKRLEWRRRNVKVWIVAGRFRVYIQLPPAMRVEGWVRVTPNLPLIPVPDRGQGVLF